jgi:hypothetical protein
MRKHRAIVLLKLAFILGAITDAVAAVPMLSPKAAQLLWGFQDFSGPYLYAMCIGAALMVAWTLLLIWAAFMPIERRMVALLTLMIIVWFLVTEIIFITMGILTLDKALLSICMQVILSTLYTIAFLYSRPSNLQLGNDKARI